VIRATVVADSVNPQGARLTTFELVAPKQLVAQFNTHGMIRRDSASSRAVPTLRILEQVRSDPYRPSPWTYRQRGMQPAGPMTPGDAAAMDRIEADLRRAVIEAVAEMERIRAAKEDINRYLEPWMWTTIVATATEWDNYLALRDHGDAQAAHARLARAMREALDASTPVRRGTATGDPLNRSAWHLPYVTEEERYGLPDWRHLPLISAARCAGVSYFRQGATKTLAEEVERALDLVRARHWSPTEMPALAVPGAAWHGPYRGWKPLRKHYGGESGSAHHGTQRDEPWVLR
jgi:hypothetical protein